MMTGRVDETKRGHHVGTVFFSFVGPLFPLRSMYVVREAQRAGRADALAHTLREAGLPHDDPARLADGLGRDGERFLPTSYALARYRGVDDHGCAQAADALWKHLERT